MNRLYQLQDTLPKNILDNEDYDELEFIVLDYNSQDGMDAWVRENMGKYIENGKLIYYRTFEPVFFNHSHAKNLALKLGTGQIVCNINADHFTGPGFARYVNDSFMTNDNIVLTPIPEKFYSRKPGFPPGDVWGKVCLRKDDFARVRGFDERMIKFGNDDIDLINRLETAGVGRMIIKDSRFWQFVAHSQEVRFSARKIVNDLTAIYVSYRSPSSSEVIFLYRDSKFERGILRDNECTDAGSYIRSYQRGIYGYKYSLRGIERSGKWTEDINKGYIQFCYEGAEDEFRLRTEYTDRYDILMDSANGFSFYEVSDPEVFEKLSTFNFALYNVGIMENNLDDKATSVNPEGYGEARVFRNFHGEYPIYV